jgi:hypothetical protein
MDDNEFQRRLHEAVENVAAMDAIDGWPNHTLLEIIAALKAGIRNPESNAQFDALVMLVNLRLQELAKSANTV